MDRVGYRDFSPGLPCNLIPIRRADYVDLERAGVTLPKRMEATASRYTKTAGLPLGLPASPVRCFTSWATRGTATACCCRCSRRLPVSTSRFPCRQLLRSPGSTRPGGNNGEDALMKAKNAQFYTKIDVLINCRPATHRTSRANPRSSVGTEPLSWSKLLLSLQPWLPRRQYVFD